MNFKNLAKAIGPGILFASSAIGVSHLVQSTRAGADYGVIMILFIFMANLFKYPFFEFGPRYAIATKQSLLIGYKNLSKYVLYIYYIFTIATMFIITAAVSFVTIGLAENLFQTGMELKLFSFIFLLFCSLILAIGKYKTLDTLTKLIGFILVVSTIGAFLIAYFKFDFVPDETKLNSIELFKLSSISFILSLMGWMPSTIDVAAWNSEWTLERIKQTNYKPTLKEAMFDFRFGYIISAVMAFVFLGMGYIALFNSKEPLSNNSVAFANQLINVYAAYLGKWSYFIIAVSAFTTMFSTTIIVIDGFARIFDKSTQVVFDVDQTHLKRFYQFMCFAIPLGSLFIIFFYIAEMKTLVDLSTKISFLMAPFFAIVNFMTILSKDVPEEYKPGKFLIILSIFGLFYLVGFSLVYIYLSFFQ